MYIYLFMRIRIIHTESTRASRITAVNSIITTITITETIHTVTMQRTVINTMVYIKIPHIIYIYMYNIMNKCVFNSIFTIIIIISILPLTNVGNVFE